MAFFGDDIVEKYDSNCSERVVTTVSDLVEVVDNLYKKEINRSFSPAILLKDKGLNQLCSN